MTRRLCCLLLIASALAACTAQPDTERTYTHPAACREKPRACL